MVKLRKKFAKNSRIPGWVITLEALVVALAVHGLLVLIDVRPPERRASSAPESPGVTILSENKLSPEEWSQLREFVAIQDPSLFARAKYTSGYGAQMKRTRQREIMTRRREAGIQTPGLPPLAEYLPLPPLPGGSGQSTLLPARRNESPVPPVLTPKAFNENGEPIALDNLRVPPGSGAYRPSIVKIWTSSGSLRIHLTESCGVPELDAIALQAAAGEKRTGTLLIYWPEPATEETI